MINNIDMTSLVAIKRLSDRIFKFFPSCIFDSLLVTQFGHARESSEESAYS